ncbi:MAG: T9SS type A sorting domain-containing protein [Verrucomicrobiota bacterium]
MDAAHFGVIKKNAVVPAPKRLTLHQFVLNAESYEGQLIEIDTLYKSSGTWPAVAANVSIYLSNVSSKGDSVQMFLDLDVSIAGVEPLYPINVVGIVSQYSAAAPWSNGYEIMPRGISDIKAIKVTGVNSVQSGLPTAFELGNNYPNPFNPTTQIRFALPQQSMAKLAVYDMLGREVCTLVNGMVNAGYFETTWNGRNTNGAQVSSGMYMYRIEAGSFIAAKKMLLLK